MTWKHASPLLNMHEYLRLISAVAVVAAAAITAPGLGSCTWTIALPRPQRSTSHASSSGDLTAYITIDDVLKLDY